MLGRGTHEVRVTFFRMKWEMKRKIPHPRELFGLVMWGDFCAHKFLWTLVRYGDEKQIGYFNMREIDMPFSDKSLLLIPAGQPRIVEEGLWFNFDDRLFLFIRRLEHRRGLNETVC